jgi:hypothetical protein
MIRHIVMFRLKDFPSAEEKEKSAETVKSELLSMRLKIAEIREFEVGININKGNSAWDLVINSVFESAEDLRAYQVHPAHQAFIAFNKDYSAAKAIVDYTF